MLNGLLYIGLLQPLRSDCKTFSSLVYNNNLMHLIYLKVTDLENMSNLMGLFHISEITNVYMTIDLTYVFYICIQLKGFYNFHI